MIKKDIKYLYDILNAIEGIEIHIIGILSYPDYILDENYTKRKAIERELEIIGEAVRKYIEFYPQNIIENSKQIIGLRNRIIHSYDSVDNADIYNIIRNHIPKLKLEIKDSL